MMSRRNSQAGMTLIELMAVVIIVGVLSAIAVFMFTRQSRKAKAAEVSAVFAELKIRQEQYFLVNSTYACLPNGGAPPCEDNSFFPDDSPTDSARTYDPTGTTWVDLRVNADRTALYCVYSSAWGTGSDAGNIGTIAGETAINNGFEHDTPPAVPWYYLLAECNFDGDSTVNSRYFARSDREGMSINNEGR
jgi:prepilin-type N-terminal cleavage/methylation domain-containing protein